MLVYGFFTGFDRVVASYHYSVVKVLEQSGRILLMPLWPVKPSTDENTDVILSTSARQAATLRHAQGLPTGLCL